MARTWCCGGCRLRGRLRAGTGAASGWVRTVRALFRGPLAGTAQALVAWGVVAHLRWVADPEGADAQAERRHQRRGLWLAPTLDGMVAVDGLLEPEAGQTPGLHPRPTRPLPTDDTRSRRELWRRGRVVAAVAGTVEPEARPLL